MRVRKVTGFNLPWWILVGPRKPITKDTTTWWNHEPVSAAFNGHDRISLFNRSTSYQLYVSGVARDGDGQPARLWTVAPTCPPLHYYKSFSVSLHFNRFSFVSFLSSKNLLQFFIYINSFQLFFFFRGF